MLRGGHLECREAEHPGSLLHGVEKLGAISEPTVRVAGGGPRDEFIDFRRHTGDHAGGKGDIPVQSGHRRAHGVCLAERRVAGEQLEQQDARGVDIRRLLQRTALYLLGGEVADCADDLAIVRGSATGIHPGGDGADQPEISEFHLVGIADQHVIRFDIPVDHARGVSHGERGEYWLHHGQSCVRGHGPAFLE